jgi:hypothetical protein
MRPSAIQGQDACLLLATIDTEQLRNFQKFHVSNIVKQPRQPTMNEHLPEKTWSLKAFKDLILVKQTALRRLPINENEEFLLSVLHKDEHAVQMGSNREESTPPLRFSQKFQLARVEFKYRFAKSKA